MSHIKNIEIKNFKSIRHAKIEDCRRVNVFVGYPNVGKSNILEAIGGFSLLNRKLFESNSLKDIIRFSRFTDLFFNADTRVPVHITINGELDLVYGLSDLDKLSLFIGGLGEASNKSNVSIRRGETYLKTVVNKDGSFLFAEGVDIEHTGKALIKKYTYNSNSVFKSAGNLNLNIPYGRNLNDVLENNPDLRKEYNEILKQYGLNLNFDRTVEGNKLELKRTLPDGTTYTLDWDLIADTLKRLFFYKAAIQSNQNSILLFEEPEAHMFPPYIAKFTMDVMYDKNNNQYFIATHSPFVLNDFMEDMDNSDLSIYAVGYVNGETTIIRLTDKQVNDIYQYGVDLFFNLEDFLKDVVA
jgi:AAA15 family ATPase/GTPase